MIFIYSQAVNFTLVVKNMGYKSKEVAVCNSFFFLGTIHVSLIIIFLRVWPMKIKIRLAREECVEKIINSIKL